MGNVKSHDIFSTKSIIWNTNTDVRIKIKEGNDLQTILKRFRI